MYSSFMVLWGAVATATYLRGDFDAVHDWSDASCGTRRSLSSSGPIGPFGDSVPGAEPAGTQDLSWSSFLVQLFAPPEDPLEIVNRRNGFSPAAAGAPRRRLASGGGAYVFEEIAWTPFPYSPHIGIIISSISQVKILSRVF